MSSTLPLAILGGSDRKPVALPDRVQRHPLTGCKGVDVRVGGRYLIDLLIERLQTANLFDPIYVAGPRTAYERIESDVVLVDTDESFGRNIRSSIETVQERSPGRMAICTCDILPEPDELAEVLDDWREHMPNDLWFPIVQVSDRPEDLGDSAWKPRYRIDPEDGRGPVHVLPGHLTIFDPAAMRLRFLYQLMDTAYESRNTPISSRRVAMVRRLVPGILLQDVVNLFRGRAPLLTFDVIVSGLRAAEKLRQQVITRTELEDALRRMFVHRRHRRRHPERRIRLPVIRALGLARDIDTEEEARAIGATATT